MTDAVAHRGTPTSLLGLEDAFQDEAAGLEGRVVAESVRQRLFGGAPQTINIGRFRLGAAIGRGAMGVVHEAYDDNLERKVAIKFITPEGAQAPEAKLRMLREARAMAKLSHPNVVAVFEEGEFEGRVYIAMEFVDGPTVREWMREPRSSDEILGCFLGAGKGLASAHQAGMVHRDFKPENVLLGEDGVPKVADFGLAGVDANIEAVTQRMAAAVSDRLTQEGIRVGTALYMALEQHRGEDATAASDQFAFCVSLFEALHGAHPFHDGDFEATLEAMRKGAVRSQTPRRPAAAIRRVLDRGLHSDPAQRFPSMDGLLYALERAGRSRRGWWFGGAAVLLAGGLWASQEPPEEPCQGVSEALSAVWNDSARSKIEAAFAGPSGEPVAERINSLVDAYDERWSHMRLETCLATHRGEQSADVLDLRMRCLDERRSELEASLAVVTRTEPDQRRGAVDVVAGLPLLDTCANVEWLEAAQPGDPAAEFAKESQALREGVATMKAQLRGGRMSEAKALAEELVATAEAIGDARAGAEVLAWLGWVEAGDETFEAARAKLHEAFYTAGAVGLDELSALIACDIANMEVYEDPKRAEQWQRHAKMTLQRGRLLGTGVEAYYEHSVGIRLTETGDHTGAVERFERALALWESSPSTDRGEVSSTHRSLGLALLALLRRDEARHHLERALELRLQTYGEAHTTTVSARIALAGLDQSEAHHEDAVAQLKTALRYAEEALGSDHVKVADICNNISAPLLTLQRNDSAIAYLERARDIYATLPEHEEDLAMVAFNLGNLFGSEARYPESKAAYERAAASWKATRGPNDSRTLRARVGGALVMADLGEPKAAQELLAAVVPLFDVDRDGAMIVAEMHGVLASVSFDAGDPRSARHAAEEGLRLAALDPEGSEVISEYLETLLREHPE